MNEAKDLDAKLESIRQSFDGQISGDARDGYPEFKTLTIICGKNRHCMPTRGGKHRLPALLDDSGRAENHADLRNLTGHLRMRSQTISSPQCG